MYSKNKAVKKPLLIVVCIFLLCSSFSVIAGAESASDFTMSDDLMAAVAAGEIDPEKELRQTIGKSTAELTSAITLNGTYFLNNKYSGQYLQYTSSGATSNGGFTSSLGSAVRWTISTTSNGATIRSVNSPTKYLAVSSDTSKITVEFVTVSSGGTIPSRCYWEISIAAGGGCIIKNKYNSKYLCTYGNDDSDGVHTVENLGSSEYNYYNSRVWRILSTSSISGRELQTNTVFHKCDLLVGNSDVYKVRKIPDNAIWSGYSDFQYSGYSSIISINSKTGYITPSQTGTTKIRVKHKPTNTDFELTVKVWSTSVNKGALNTWNDVEGNFVGKWATTPSIFKQKLDPSANFFFNIGCEEATSAWNTALGINMQYTSTESSAKIKVYGGTRQQLQEKGGFLSGSQVGLTRFTYNCTGYHTYSASSTGKTKLQAKILSAEVYILSRGSSANTTKNVCTHEFGHALGYFGHSYRTSDVMYYQCHEGYTLSSYEKTHLQQIYN